MKRAISYLKTLDRKTLLWVALAFGVTSAVYLAWLDRLVLLTGPASDWLSLVAGYLSQAAGTLIACALFRRASLSGGDGEEGERGAAAFLRQSFALTVILFAVVAVPAILTDSPPAAIAFGLVMNLLCGVIAGYYLWVVCAKVDPAQRSAVFGGGYAVASIGVGLIAIAQLTRGWTTVPVCLALSTLLIWVTWRFDCMGLAESAAPAMAGEAEGSEPSPAGKGAGLPRLLPLACAAIVLASVVKNLGFTFPSADIQAGLIPEIARIPYAAGLVAAGLINDRSRKNGLACTLAALIVPFVMLGLIHEPISSAVFWGLDYVFYAFFSVFRVVIVMDIVAPRGREDASGWPLAPVGLLAGRVGDVVGSGIGLSLAGHQVALIVTTAALFIPTVFVLYRLYEACFAPRAAQQRTEKEIFNLFCVHNDLSARERDVLEMLLAGQTNANISQALFISENTVKYHVKNILQKTGCKNRVDLRDRYTQAAYPPEKPPLPFGARNRRGGA